MTTEGNPPADNSPDTAVASASPARVKTGANLWPVGAAVRSFFNRSLDFYPRLESKVRSVPPQEIIERFYVPPDGAMAEWNSIQATDPGLDKALELAKASLQEVKAQTEYQDQKATRLLTVTTFLTALAGAFFAAFAGDYPLRSFSDLASGPYWLLVATYCAFLAFVVLALLGALVTFHATRTTFKYPAEATVARQAGPTRSYLFYREIIGVTPEGWASSFVKASGGSAAINTDLKVEYLKNYVSEAYLVAAKTADKLRYLQPAQSLLAYALRCLLAYVVLYASVTVWLVPTKSPPAPTKIEVNEPKEPFAVRLVPSPQSNVQSGAKTK